MVLSTPPNQMKAWFLPTSPQGKGRQLLGFLTEAQGVIPAPLVVSLSPPGRGQAQSVGHRGAQEKFWTGWLTFMQAQ